MCYGLELSLNLMLFLSRILLHLMDIMPMFCRLFFTTMYGELSPHTIGDYKDKSSRPYMTLYYGEALPVLGTDVVSR